MEIVKSIKLDEQLEPDLYYLLKSVPNEIIYNLEHKLRHPLAIYNISSSRVFENFKKCLKSLQGIFVPLSTEEEREVFLLNMETSMLKHKLKTCISTESDNIRNQIVRNQMRLRELSEKTDVNNTHIFDDYPELLTSLMAFIDDTYHIIKCFFPANTVTEQIIFADKWFKKADKSTCSEYKDNIKEYRDKLSVIVNKIKHNHARLRYIEFKTDLGIIPGYFVEGTDSNGAVGPDREIHQVYDGMDTGFSFYRDLRYHLVQFYFVSFYLKTILEKIIKNKQALVITIEKKEDKKNDRAFEVCSNIASLPNIFFYDEYFQPAPSVIFNNQENTVELSYPSLQLPEKYSAIMGISNSTIGDGVSKTFKIPYFKGIREKSS